MGSIIFTVFTFYLFILVFRNIQVMNFLQDVNREVYKESLERVSKNQEWEHLYKYFEKFRAWEQIKMVLIPWMPCKSFFTGTVLEEIVNRI